MTRYKQGKNKPNVIFFRGEFVPYEDAKVSVLCHGLNYGTGCFEGIRGYWNEPKKELFMLKLRAHFERIHQSARILHMTLGHTVDDLCSIATELVRRNQFKEDVYVRPLLFMGDEVIGVRLHNLTTEFTMFAVPMGSYISTGGIRVEVSAWRRIDDNAVPARSKITGAYVNSALAKTEAFHNGFDDAIFLNQDGHVSEGSAMNLFMVRHGTLVTPSVHQNILEGVTRRAVMRIAEEVVGMKTIERPIDRTELYVCDELFLCGTGAQIAPIVEVDRRKVNGTATIGPVTQRIMDVYNKAVRGDEPRFLDWVTPVYQSMESRPHQPGAKSS